MLKKKIRLQIFMQNEIFIIGKNETGIEICLNIHDILIILQLELLILLQFVPQWYILII